MRLGIFRPDRADGDAISAHREVFNQVCGVGRDRQPCQGFVRRAQAWPRGYPADFETIEQLVSHANHAPEGTVAWLIESYCLGSPFAQQHRNRVAHQAALITDAVLRPGPPPRVLLIAAGAAPDLRLVSPQIAGHGCRFVLNDHDPAALDRLLRRQLDPQAMRNMEKILEALRGVSSTAASSTRGSGMRRGMAILTRRSGGVSSRKIT